VCNLHSGPAATSAASSQAMVVLLHVAVLMVLMTSH
jgi:hypothetical protein